MVALAMLGATTLADARPKPRIPSALQAYRAARRECAAPGPRLAALTAALRADLVPEAFGAKIIDNWEALTVDQRARFIDLAERVVLRELRDDLVRILCDRKDRVDRVSERCTDDGCFAQISVQHITRDDAIGVNLEFRRDPAGWSFVLLGVPSMDLPEPQDDELTSIGGNRYDVVRHWRHRLGQGRYDAAITALEKLERINRATR